MPIILEKDTAEVIKERQSQGPQKQASERRKCSIMALMTFPMLDPARSTTYTLDKYVRPWKTVAGRLLMLLLRSILKKNCIDTTTECLTTCYTSYFKSGYSALSCSDILYNSILFYSVPTAVIQTSTPLLKKKKKKKKKKNSSNRRVKLL